MLSRIFAAPISYFRYSIFYIFCVLAGVDELNLKNGSREDMARRFLLPRLFASKVNCYSHLFHRMFVDTSSIKVYNSPIDNTGEV